LNDREKNGRKANYYDLARFNVPSQTTKKKTTKTKLTRRIGETSQGAPKAKKSPEGDTLRKIGGGEGNTDKKKSEPSEKKKTPNGSDFAEENG